jgi:5-formyltetrahydrofolate cyclo-ligase
MIHQEKQTLRMQMRATLMAFSGKTTASAHLRALLREAAPWKAARVVYGFAPLRTEPDWQENGPGKILAFPRATAHGLEFFTGGELIAGPHGAREPRGGRPAPPPDLVLVPGLAFDSRGRRLGRGGGFYDRFLATLRPPVPLLCGVCFSCQIVPEVPAEPHDVRMDFVLSETGWITASGIET